MGSRKGGHPGATQCRWYKLTAATGALWLPFRAPRVARGEVRARLTAWSASEGACDLFPGHGDQPDIIRARTMRVISVQHGRGRPVRAQGSLRSSFSQPGTASRWPFGGTRREGEGIRRSGVEDGGRNGDLWYKIDGFLTWQEMRDVYENSRAILEGAEHGAFRRTSGQEPPVGQCRGNGSDRWQSCLGSRAHAQVDAPR